MKKLESTFANMAVVLVAVAVITGGLLAWINNITEPAISTQAQKTLADGIKTVMQADDLNVTANDTLQMTADGKECQYIIHATAAADGTPLGAAVESTTGGFGGDLRVLVGLTADGTVLGYTILQTGETPGLGAKADKWFQKDGKGSIIGRKMADGQLTVSKDGGQIDAITASTITSRAFLKAVNNAYTAYTQYAQKAKPACKKLCGQCPEGQTCQPCDARCKIK